MSKKLTKAQIKALSKVKKLVEINILQLEEKKYGFSTKGDPNVPLDVLIDVLSGYIVQLDKFAGLNPGCTWNDFTIAEKSKTMKPS